MRYLLTKNFKIFILEKPENDSQIVSTELTFSDENVSKSLLEIPNIDKLIIFTGPGSYSLLRSIISFVNGFCLASNITEVKTISLDLKALKLGSDQIKEMDDDDYFALLTLQEIKTSKIPLAPIYFQEI